MEEVAAVEINDVVETPPPAVVETAPEVDTSTVDEARKRGWRPKEEYKGEEANWVDASEFLKLTEDNVVFQRRAVRELSEKVDKMHSFMNQMAEVSEREKKEATQRAYQQAIADMTVRITQAAQEGDTANLHQMLMQRDQLQQDFQRATITPQVEQNIEVQRQRLDWENNNPWYRENMVLRDWANQQSQVLAQQGVPPAEQFKRITESVKTQFPQLFTNPNKQSAPMVTNTNSNAPIQRTAAKERKYENMTAEGRRLCDEFVTNGKYSFGKDEKELRDRYVGIADAEFFK